jgi:hypothetical protein
MPCAAATLFRIKTMTSKPTRGGARPGAGRKPRAIPRKAVTVRLEPKHADKLRKLSKASKTYQAGWIGAKIEQAKK